MPPRNNPKPKTEKYGITNPEVLTTDHVSAKVPEASDANDSDNLSLDDTTTLLARDTHDGKGDDEVPPADFHSFATEGVEDDGSALKFRETVESVLAGEFGDFQERRVALKDAGHNVSKVMLEVNRRLASGSPSAHAKADLRTTASQLIWGEWGTDKEEIQRNLAGAGHVVHEVEAEALRQLGG